jgi:hypothetical protein
VPLFSRLGTISTLLRKSRRHGPGEIESKAGGPANEVYAKYKGDRESPNMAIVTNSIISLVNYDEDDDTTPTPSDAGSITPTPASA